MQEIYLHDQGGVEPDASDICTDELVCYLDGINSVLGTKDDPRFGEYQEFCASLDEASILKIEPDQISSGKYDGLDLTGGDEDTVIINEPTDKDLFGMSVTDWIKTACFVTPNSNVGTVYADGYLPVSESAFVLPV